MVAVINGTIVQGTPQEIVEYQKLVENKDKFVITKEIVNKFNEMISNSVGSHSFV